MRFRLNEDGSARNIEIVKSLGEAFDKTAKLLGLGFPGGPQIEKFALNGNPNKFDLPKPIFHRGGCNLSFAGLKTAVLNYSKKIRQIIMSDNLNVDEIIRILRKKDLLVA